MHHGPGRQKTSLSARRRPRPRPHPRAPPPSDFIQARCSPASNGLGPAPRAQPAAPGSSPPALPQDEPPWMAMAKKKAKAWSEMPQIVQ
ncbi:hypothetical protein NHX12_011701 [Muraenolepis orangiensis]|uniref:Uncharacterized protein n=1 Tax=Muraenolepis orangiensis TaxID=630683 RepID=A0A9Q0DIA4_9TELE|nr:hypothetical protein NHX12_011701 [Muraenolepis orangiensis]